MLFSSSMLARLFARYSCSKSLRASTKTTTSLAQRRVALRRLPSINATSPTVLPAEIVAAWCPWASTSTLPSTMTKQELPGSPCLQSRSPD